jgi:hypothetical protein
VLDLKEFGFENCTPIEKKYKVFVDFNRQQIIVDRCVKKKRFEEH